MEWFTETAFLIPNFVWIIIAAVVVIAAVVIIILVSKNSKKKKKQREAALETNTALGDKAYKSFEGLYFNEKGEKVIVNGANVWLVNVQGKTELVKSVDEAGPTAEGEKIYLVSSDTITRIVKVGNDFEKVETENSNYLTITFINRAKLSIGDTVYVR